MISKKNYDLLKKKYGDVASWAIWNMNYSNVEPKKNTSDLSVFEDDDLLSKINTGYVFVGLNASSTHGDVSHGAEAWYNFHSSYSRQNDYKLRYALQGTKYWGSYITDVIKHYEEVDSSKVQSYLAKNPGVVKENIIELKRELDLLGTNLILVALGGATYKILRQYLSAEYEIKQIKHYSFTIGKEDYRREVLSILENESQDAYVENKPSRNKTVKKKVKSKVKTGNEGLIEYFRQHGLEYSNGTRDIHFKKNGKNVWITDQQRNFAVYALAEESEKDFYIKVFNEFNPIPGSVRRNPEPSSPKKCCARYEHTKDDYALMFDIVNKLLG